MTATATDSPIACALLQARERTLRLVENLSVADLERQHSPLMSPLVWDLGHIASYEDLWLAHRAAGAPLLREDLAVLYDAFETPRPLRGKIEMPGAAEAREHLAAVRGRVLELLERDGGGDPTLGELVVRHEHQHNETMLQALQLARINGSEPPDARRAPPALPGKAPSGLVTTLVPCGRCTIGAGADGFAYDNERPGREVDVASFEIGRVPLTNGDWLAFISDGGYERRELWTDAGWAWRSEEQAERPLHWTADGREWRIGRRESLDPAKPVIHVSHFEAEAAARWAGGRLPTEIEWEKAATWDERAGAARRWPWGDDAPDAGRANLLDFGVYGPSPVATAPSGASPYGVLGMIGDVWEWTASEFDGYPGFVAHPYREYSEVFFRQGYRVLRGGSWATTARVASPTFRNWDHPQRRQIFSGVRIARDA